MIKNILFDLGGVLMTNGTVNFIKYIVDTYKLDPEYTRDIIDGDIGSQYREGKISRDRFWEQVLAELKLPLSAEAYEQIWIDSYQMIPGTVKIVEELTHDYNVYYLSDHVKERVVKLDEKFGFLKLFKLGVFSFEVGFRKPNPQLYKHALEITGSLPEETVFIDDKESAIVPAQNLGINCIHFISPEDLRANLLKLGVELADV